MVKAQPPDDVGLDHGEPFASPVLQILLDFFAVEPLKEQPRRCRPGRRMACHPIGQGSARSGSLAVSFRVPSAARHGLLVFRTVLLSLRRRGGGELQRVTGG